MAVVLPLKDANGGKDKPASGDDLQANDDSADFSAPHFQQLWGHLLIVVSKSRHQCAGFFVHVLDALPLLIHAHIGQPSSAEWQDLVVKKEKAETQVIFTLRRRTEPPRHIRGRRCDLPN